MINSMQEYFGNDMEKFVESTFRVRDASGTLIDYKMVDAHRRMLKTGLLGNRSALKRIILKGRRGGFSTFEIVETCTIAQLMPLSYQYYIATKEEQSKKWLRKLEQVSTDARNWPDGARIIDIDSTKSSQLEKVFKHVPKDARKALMKKIDLSYVCGLAASPGGIRGEGAVKLVLDEMAWMVQRHNQQEEVYAAVKKFVMAGGALSILSTPRDRVALYWRIYENAEKYLFTPFYFPTIVNWQDLDLNMPLYAEMDMLDKHELKLIQSSDIYQFSKRTVMRKDGNGVPFEKEIEIAFQKCKIPYWWLDLRDIESDRREDLDIFKQENLCIPAESISRFIPKELVDNNIIHETRYTNDKGGFFKIGMDVAQKQDLSAITIAERLSDGTVQERWIEESQDPYPIQFEKIIELCQRYKPMEIIIDNTGIGEAVGDMIVHRGTLPPLRRVDFRSYVELQEKKTRIKEFMAEAFKKALVDGKYKMLNNRVAIDHILEVEKVVTDSDTIRYSGKKGGTRRDDHFWSKCLVNHGFSNLLYKTGAFFSMGEAAKKGKQIQKITQAPQTEGFSMW